MTLLDAQAFPPAGKTGEWAPDRPAGGWGLPAVDLTGLQVTAETLALVPAGLARQHGLLPLAHDDRRLQVAIGDPLATDGLDSLAYLTGLEVIPALARSEDICAALERFYGTPGMESGRLAPSDRTAAPVATDERAEEDESDAPIIQLVQSIIQAAVQQRASDIHFEPLEKRFRVRCRIDGVLIEVASPPKRLQPSIISRLKIMAGISIAEKRIPQDGRMQVAAGGRPLDLRVSSLPTAHGESVVLRILDRRNLRLDLSELGLAGEDRLSFARLLARPDGLVLVTGPTGSGKTTTLYSCLHHLNRPDCKIITVEDPVEYQLTGINQVPVRPEIGMTFASALRAMLRQAPNIVMIGEIRDLETAGIAVNASLTGHLVFSTLHTNDAPGAIARLVDLGVKPFLLASALRAVVAQRLVRRVCPDCRQPVRPEPSELRALSLTPEQTAAATFMKGAGCPACHGTGYHGRVGIFEVLVVDEEIQTLISAGASTSKLREKARAAGLRTLRENGARLVTAGLTTAEEVVSITTGDDQ